MHGLHQVAQKHNTTMSPSMPAILWGAEFCQLETANRGAGVGEATSFGFGRTVLFT